MLHDRYHVREGDADHEDDPSGSGDVGTEPKQRREMRAECDAQKEVIKKPHAGESTHRSAGAASSPNSIWPGDSVVINLDVPVQSSTSVTPPGRQDEVAVRAKPIPFGRFAPQVSVACCPFRT